MSETTFLWNLMPETQKRELFTRFCHYCGNTANTYITGDVTYKRLESWINQFNYWFDPSEAWVYFQDNFLK